MFGSSGSRTSTGSKVVLNVYDLAPHNAYTHDFGIGAYHSGVQVGGREYTFAGGSGVFYHDPKEVPGEATFRESIELGTYNGTSMALDKILDELKPQFPGDSYNILSKNCNHFSDAFVYSLLHVRIPSYVNRLANFGDMFSCLLPPSLTNQAPVGQDNEQSQSYQVNVPRGRRTEPSSQNISKNPSSNQVFSRNGFVLGAGSANSDGKAASDDAKERREKMRAAALSRLEK